MMNEREKGNESENNFRLFNENNFEFWGQSVE